MKPIGGYFELELELGQASFHTNAYSFKSGRASLLYILHHMKPSRVYIPYYTCDGLLEPFFVADVPFAFYAVNKQLEPETLPVLKQNEYFLYINYFDLKRKCVAELSDLFGDKLIVDCSQAFFMKGNGRSWYFNSCRKFFGTPDGSYLYCPAHYDMMQVLKRNEQFTVEHLVRRFNGNVESGYSFFQLNETMCGPEISRISKLSEYLLSKIDFTAVMRSRRSNFYYLQSVFSDRCFLDSEGDEEAVPMVFPALWDKKINRKQLSVCNVFIPIFWMDVIKRDHEEFALERQLSNKILPLPVDHRYKLEDMVRMETLIKNIK